MSIEVRARAALHHALAEPHRLAIVDALRVTDHSPGSLREVTGMDWSLLAFHLNTLEAVGLVERRVSEGDRRRRYVRLLPSALAALWPADEVPAAERVLFVCTHNAARSQFAAGLWALRSVLRASSAGADPAPAVHPLAVATAEAYGVDLTDARPRGYEAVTEQPGLVVSVCDRALERGIPFEAKRLHWSVPDPVGGDRDAFEAAFADIAERVDRLSRRVAA